MTHLDAAAFDLAVRRGARVLDVRPEAARRRDPVPGAEPLDLDELRAGAVPGGPHDQPLLLVCERGLVSELAALYLEDEGFRDVRHLAGGLRAWRAWRADGERGH